MIHHHAFGPCGRVEQSSAFARSITARLLKGPGLTLASVHAHPGGGSHVRRRRGRARASALAGAALPPSELPPLPAVHVKLATMLAFCPLSAAARPPRAGQSRLPRRLTTILPALSLAETLHTTYLHRVPSLTGICTAVVTTDPRRVPTRGFRTWGAWGTDSSLVLTKCTN
jgi:hypothetical protein